MDHVTKYNDTKFYYTKSYFVEPKIKKFGKWKIYGKPVMYIRLNNALENKVLIKIANDSQCKLGITMEHTRKGMPKRNYLTESGFTDCRQGKSYDDTD